MPKFLNQKTDSILITIIQSLHQDILVLTCHFNPTTEHHLNLFQIIIT